MRWSVLSALCLLGLLGCERPERPPDQPRPSNPDAEQVVSGRALGSLATAVEAPGQLGQVAAVPCRTCHDDPARWEMARAASELDEFHQGLRFEHGTNVCASCHAPDQRDMLRLADGTQIAFKDTMRLCGQCHGGQLRDYEHGAHGGMAGYWDTARGPRVRSLCTNCHDPHAPAYPSVLPAPPPRDRFMKPRAAHHEASHD